MEFLFYLFSIVLISSAVGVVVMRNPIHSALFLVLNLMTVAAVFAMLEAHFLATVQIIVYAGAIMVLVVFVIMLLNIKDERHDRARQGLIAVAGVASVLFIAVLVVELTGEMGEPVELDPAGVGDVLSIGRLLYSKYVFPFEAASVLILAAIIGAVMLAKRDHKGREERELPLRQGGQS